ncbi:MAG: sugar ABC transporter substrate-binding protein [Lachnospiraceae bacterium]|nr:sugar ABC transporter substrate-binding protein [Lachnospiraceae bacterium]
MALRKRLITVLVIALLVGGIYGTARIGMTVYKSEEAEVAEDSLFGHRETLYLWYTDEALTDYLNSVAVSYSEYQDDVRVVPVYTSGLEYLETINQASLHSDEVPDLYIVSNDSLEKAYLAGLASEVKVPEGAFTMEDIFPETAIHAVTYHDKQIAYPFYFETSCFLYNKTYMEDWAKAQLEAEADLSAGEEAQAEADNAQREQEASDSGESGDASVQESADTSEDSDASGETAEAQSAVTEEAIEAKVEEALPSTIDDILSFADVYDAPEQVEAVFKWDVSDIFYNYFFVGDHIDVGGIDGDRADSIHIYNEDAIRCMRVYQDLNQFFSIDTKEISYDSVLQDFMNGKIVYTVVTSDALTKIETAKAEGNFDYEYGMSTLPDVSENLSSSSLSVTQCVVVNGYSVQKEMANDFAVYLTEYDTDSLFGRTGKLPVYANGTTYDNPNAAAYMEEYKDSVPMPKMIETSNFWVELEIAFAKIWDGDDANDDLKALSEKIMSQVVGEEYTEEYIDVPVETEEDEEMLEEDMETDEESGEDAKSE